MPRLDSALQLLADIATLRGRTKEAEELRSAAERLATTGPDDGSPAVRAALDQIQAHGTTLTDSLLEEIPADLRLLNLAGTLTVADLAALHGLTGGTRLGDLDAALRAGSLDGPLAGRLRAALDAVAPQRRRTPLGRARPYLESLARAYLETCPALTRLEPAGSVRRFDATVGDLELVGAAADTAAALAQLSRAVPGTLLHEGKGRIVLRTEGTELTIRLVTPDHFGLSWLHLTGSWRHLEELGRLARARGLDLSWTPASDRSPFAGLSEEEIYARLDLPFIPPEMREGAGEIEAAASGALPRLVTRPAIRGDLHMHTDWSDGRDSLEDMVRAAEQLGYDYVAVTDHSASSKIAGGLDASRLDRQRDAVERLRERHPGIAILHGSEVDILPDGRLDFPDRVLERLDVVLASLHDPAGQSGGRLTDRYVAAMRHPLVHIVTHPTNRLVPSRAGYELDETRLFATALETGTFLEIDGAPGHLDMDGAMARRAVAAGVPVAVDGDCHRADLLGRHMDFAVGTARRGWVQPGDALNTRPLPELRSLLARKRS